MLDEKDIHLIGVEFGKVLERTVMPKFRLIFEDLKDIRKELTGIKSVMVTKDYLDEKMG